MVCYKLNGKGVVKMKKSMKRLMCGTLAAGFLFLASCGGNSSATTTPAPASSGQPQSASPAGNKVYSLVTASLGGTYYIVGSGLAEVINQNVDGITVNNVVSQGSTGNAIKVGTGESELGITNYYAGIRAIDGVAPFEQSYDIMGICSLQYSIIQFNSLASSGITKMTDLKGKKVSIGPAGGGGALIFEELLPYWDLSMNDMTVSYMSYADGGEALTDGRIDVNVPHGAPPLEAISTTAVTNPISIISMEPDILEKVTADLPYYDAAVIPGGTYAGLDEDITSLGVQDILVCSADMDEETVYQITKAIYENLEYLHTIHASLEPMDFQGYKDSLVPLHPGARRFYEEMGFELD